MLSITKLQNLKAIHNKASGAYRLSSDVINHKTTKFESNSQPVCLAVLPLAWCYQSQNYKIWKQFTTMLFINPNKVQMLSIIKLQNLKAIHNSSTLSIAYYKDVINHKTTKFESSSQQTSRLLGNFLCCYQSQTTKFENNSQRATHTPARRPRCYQSQNCKIWKQFTTIGHQKRSLWELLSITKLQNLKAVHNRLLAYWVTFFVVINHKTTKFESNSQHKDKTN